MRSFGSVAIRHPMRVCGDAPAGSTNAPEMGNSFTLLTQKQKKPTWQDTLRYLTTSAYSKAGLPEWPGCAPFRLPTSQTRR